MQVSAVLTINRHHGFFESCLVSLVQQKDVDLEVIIIINNCDESTADSICKAINIYLPGAKVHYLRGKKKLGEVRNLGLELATHPFIAVLDSDDIAYESRFQVQSNFLMKNPDVVLVGSQINLIDSQGNLLPKKKRYKQVIPRSTFLVNTPLAHPSIMFRKSDALKVGGYNSSYPQSEDFEFMLRLNRLGNFVNLKNILTAYRVHDLQSSQKSRQVQLNCRMRALLNFYSDDTVGEGDDVLEALLSARFSSHRGAFLRLLFSYLLELPKPKLQKVTIFCFSIFNRWKLTQCRMFSG